MLPEAAGETDSILDDGNQGVPFHGRTFTDEQEGPSAIPESADDVQSALAVGTEQQKLPRPPPPRPHGRLTRSIMKLTGEKLDIELATDWKDNKPWF